MLACVPALAHSQSQREPQASLAPQETAHSLTISGTFRGFYLYLPTTPDPIAVPLVVVLHGAGGRALGFARHTGFTQLAAREKFAVAYPQGLERRWDDGRGLVRPRDDVGFIRAMLDTIRAEHQIDSSRIYAAGISNGAIMAHRLACDLPGTLAAIAAVAGAFPVALESHCPDSARTSLVALQGTADPLMPYDGGGVGPAGRRGTVLSARRSADFWAARDGCATAPENADVPDHVSDGTRVTTLTWSGCEAGRSVRLYTVRGGGHTWPGGPRTGPLVGRTTHELDATTTIWDFFRAHPLAPTLH
ncbi:MAG: hypothetical protein H0W67_03880 [Gemmatimonadales bacterium]|nr:hypothetical protein [Gemmatimonadales bacterium]